MKRSLQNLGQKLLIGGGLSLLIACAPTSRTNPGPLGRDWKAPPAGFLDDSTNDRSSLLHSFLVGQLSYSKDDYQTALQYFEQTSRLLDEPSPRVHAILAELYLKDRRVGDAKAEAMRAVEGEPDTHAYRLLLAGIYESLDELALAEVEYQTILKATPGSDKLPAQVYYLYSSLLARTERPKEASSLMEEFVIKYKDSQKTDLLVAYDLLGRFYELQGNDQQAEVSYQRGVKAFGLTDDLFPSLLRVYLRQEKVTEAKNLCLEKLEIFPKHRLANRILGELAISEGSVDQGLALLRGAQEAADGDDGLIGGAEASNSQALRYRIALLELERQNYEAAERELLLITAQDEEHGEARYYLASVYAGSDRPLEGIELLEQISSKSEVYVKAKMFSAFLLRQQGDLPRAANALEAVLDQAPSNLKARSYLTLILRDLGELKKSQKVLENGLALYPEDERLLFQLAVVMDDLGDTDAAMQTMQRVITVNPMNADALNFVAYGISEQEGDLIQAEILVRQALEIRPQDGYYLDTLGWILYQQSRYEEAEAILERAVALSDSDVVILEHYGDVLFKREKTEEARKIYEQIILQVRSLEEKPSKEISNIMRRVEQKIKVNS